jgi:hypothetical protein
MRHYTPATGTDKSIKILLLRQALAENRVEIPCVALITHTCLLKTMCARQNRTPMKLGAPRMKSHA